MGRRRGADTSPSCKKEQCVVETREPASHHSSGVKIRAMPKADFLKLPLVDKQPEKIEMRILYLWQALLSNIEKQSALKKFLQSLYS